MSFGRPPTFSSFQATAPDRGSFPLDHEGECSTQIQESKGYLECRMSRGLMQREDWKSLGMTDVQNLENSCTTCSGDSNLDNEKKK